VSDYIRHEAMIQHKAQSQVANFSLYLLNYLLVHLFQIHAGIQAQAYWQQVSAYFRQKRELKYLTNSARLREARLERAIQIERANSPPPSPRSPRAMPRSYSPRRDRLSPSPTSPTASPARAPSPRPTRFVSPTLTTPREMLPPGFPMPPPLSTQRDIFPVQEPMRFPTRADIAMTPEKPGWCEPPRSSSPRCQACII